MRNVKRGFTLIELMIVVAIFAVVAAVLVPNFFRARDEVRKRAAEARAKAAAVPSPPPGVAPDVRGLTGAVTLKTNTRRHGMDVVNHYDLEYQAELTFVRPARSGGPVLLAVPFPLDSETRDVRLTVTKGGRSWSPEDVLLTPEGLYWSVELAPGEEARAEVAFTSEGQSRVVLPWPANSRLELLEFALFRPQSTTLGVDSLQPSGNSPNALKWTYANLVNPKPLLLDLPANQSPQARILLLCRLVGLAVLLFGLGFWYVGELYSPGRLNSFRWGQFFLLALTYSFFFPVLAVLTLNLDLPLTQSLAWAAALSLPLLLLHVSRIVNLRFAFFYTAPLAVLTVAVVVIGVFGGAWRAVFYLGVSFVTIAFLTLSYRRWHSHRCQAQLKREEEVAARVEVLGEQARLARDEAARAQDGAPPELQERLTRARQALLTQVHEAETLTQELAELPNFPFARRCELRPFLELRTAAAERQLPLARRELNLASHHALESQARTRARHNAAPGEVFCVACGQSGGDTPCCPQCGHRRPRRLECACGCQLLLPPEGNLGSFCPGCGQRNAVLQG